MPVQPFTQPASPSATNVLRAAARHPGALAASTARAPQAMDGVKNAAQSAMATSMVPGSSEQRRQRKAQAHTALDEQPGIVTRLMDGLSRLGNIIFMYDFIALTGLGFVTGMFSTGLNKIGLTGVGGWFSRRQESLQRQSAFLENTEISAALSKTTEAMHGTAAQAFGEESAVARGMGSVAKGAASAEGAINRNVGMVFGRASSGLGSVARSFEPQLHGLAAFRQSLAEKHFARLGDPLKAAQAALTSHGDKLAVNRFNEEGKVLKATSTYLPNAKATEGATRTAAEHMENLRGNFTQLEELLKTTPDVASAPQASKLLSEIRGDYAAVRTIHAENAEMKAGLKEVGAALKKMQKPVTRMVSNVGKAESWRMLPETLKALPKNMAKTDMRHGMFAGMIGAQTLASAAHTGFGAKHEFRVLKSMVEAVEGKKVSTMHVLMGDIPPMLTEARHHYFAKFKPEVIAEAVAGVANLAFLKKGVGAMAMLPVVAAPIIGHALADQNPTIQMYEALAKLQSAGKNLTPEMYAQFVHSLVEDPKTLDMSKYRPEARERLFADYAKANTPIDQLLRDAADGSMMKRAAELEQQLNAEEKAAPTATEKPVMGQHTAKVMKGREGGVAASAQPAASEPTAPRAEAPPKSKITHMEPAGTLAAAPVRATGGAPA